MMSHNVPESNPNTTAITKEVPILEINLIKSNDWFSSENSIKENNVKIHKTSVAADSSNNVVLVSGWMFNTSVIGTTTADDVPPQNYSKH